MRILMGINAGGVFISACYVGLVFTRAYTPLWAGLAAALFLAAVFQPMIAEYLHLGSNFKELEGGYLENRRREIGQGPQVEILGANQTNHTFQRKITKDKTAFVLCALGIGLLAFDVSQWWQQRPTPPPEPGMITNF